MSPTRMPRPARESALPRLAMNHIGTSGPITTVDTIPRCAMRASTTGRTNCQKDCTVATSIMDPASRASPKVSTHRAPCRSTFEPTKGAAKAARMVPKVTTLVKAVRVQPRSSVMGLRKTPMTECIWTLLA